MGGSCQGVFGMMDIGFEPLRFSFKRCSWKCTVPEDQGSLVYCSLGVWYSWGGVSMSGEIERPSLLILKIFIHVTEIWRCKLNTRIYHYGFCAPFIYPFGTKSILSMLQCKKV